MSSQQTPCHLPAATSQPYPSPAVSAHGQGAWGEEPGWPGQVRQRARQAGGPFRARRMSGGREADRQCHPEVTSGLAWGHQEPDPTPPW